MLSKQKRNPFLLLSASLLWGVAFVAQSIGGEELGPFTFTCVRSFIGVLVLLPLMLLFDKKAGENSRKPRSRSDKKRLWIGGVLCGVFLALATNLQQMGLYLGASTAKAGFLTAFYILFVPVAGIFFHRKCGWNVWVGILIALGGLYLLSMQGGFSLEPTDILLLLCALLFTGQILSVDHYSPLVDGIRLSIIQHLVAGVLSAIPMIAYDVFAQAGSFAVWGSTFLSARAWIAILYAGILSNGVAYTLQIVGQEEVNPTIAALLMSLESVFSALAGWLILKQVLSARELLGCGLIFVAILLAQLPLPPLKKKTE